MSPVRSWLVGALAAAGTVAPVWGQQAATSVDDIRVERHGDAAPASDIEVRSWVSQTALWPGDRVSFNLEITCAPNVDVLTDDLEPEKLVLSGLEVVASNRERRVSSAGVSYRVSHELTTYDFETSPLRVGAWSVRYYVRRPGQRIEDAAPAGEARVAGVTLALRSTLPEELPAVRLRDARAAAPLPAAARHGRPLGLGLILLSGLPVALWAVPLLRRLVAAARRRRARQTRNETRSALEELRAVDAVSDAARRAGYDRLDAALRHHLAELDGFPAAALTASEIAERLQENAPRLPAEEIAAVLEDCERARYGPEGVLPSAQRFEAGLTALEGLLAGR